MVLKEDEKKYVEKSEREKSYLHYFFSSFFVLLILSGSYLVYTDGETFLSFLLLLFSLALSLFLYAFGESEKCGEMKCRYDNGSLKKNSNSYGKFSLSGKQVIVPEHWLGYLPNGKNFDKKIVECTKGSEKESKSYVTDVSNGLSVSEENGCGFKSVLDPNINPIKFFFCFLGFLVSFVGVLFSFIIPENPIFAFEASPWAYAVSFLPGACSLVATILDCRRRRKIYRMYAEKGIDGLSLWERRRLRLRGALIGGVMAVTLSSLLLFLFPGLLLFPGVNISCGVLLLVSTMSLMAFLVTPRPSQEEHKIGTLY